MRKIIFLITIFLSSIALESHAVEPGEGISFQSVEQCEKFSSELDIDCENIFKIANMKLNSIERNFSGIVDCKVEFGMSCYQKEDGYIELKSVGAIYFKGYFSDSIVPMFFSELTEMNVFPSGCPAYPGRFDYYKGFREIRDRDYKYNDKKLLEYRSLIENADFRTGRYPVIKKRYEELRLELPTYGPKRSYQIRICFR